MLELEIPLMDFLLTRSGLSKHKIWMKHSIVVADDTLFQVLLMPVSTDLPEFMALSFGDRLFFLLTCYNVRESVPQASSTSLSKACRSHTILINAALFNGALSAKKRSVWCCSCELTIIVL